MAIDLAMSPPPPRVRARGEEGLVALRTPLGSDMALAVVRELFRCIVREDGEALEALFARDAPAVTTPGPPQPGQTPVATSWWDQRFRRLDYTKLAGELLYREADVWIEGAGDDDEGPAAPGRARGAPDDELDLVLRVPVVTARVGPERLLGDEMLLWLRRSGDRYKIVRMVEDFQLP